MAHDTRAFVPRLNPACNIRTLPITPADAFVLSRVDGFTSAGDIGLITGLGDEVLPTLERLHKLGALVEGPSGGSSPAPPPQPPRPSPSPAPAAHSSSPAAPPRVQGPAVRLETKASPTPLDPKSIEAAGLPAKITKYPPAELEEDADIEPERRKRILDLFYSLGDLTHYDLLGVPPTAEKKQIKAAYYQLAQEFHPDRYFRKNVGSFKPKLEAIFKQVTEAHDVLTRAATRGMYDAELESRPQPQPRDTSSRPPVSSKPPPRSPTPPPMRELTPSPSPVATRPVVAPDPPPSPVSRPETTPSVIPTVGPEPRPLSPEEARARRQALAQRLSSGRFQNAPKAPSDPPPAPSTPVPPLSSEAALQSLRRMAAAKQVEAGRSQLERYVLAAEEAAAKNDPVAAANAYRLAVSMSPGDAKLEQLARDWGQKASVVLAAGYIRQGEAEREQGRWAEAARSFMRAIPGAPNDPVLLEQAATALVKAEGDLHQAADYARKAVALAPDNVRYRLALAEVYLAAKLTLNARRELETAAKIDPANAKVKVLLKQLTQIGLCWALNGLRRENRRSGHGARDRH